MPSPRVNPKTGVPNHGAPWGKGQRVISGVSRGEGQPVLVANPAGKGARPLRIVAQVAGTNRFASVPETTPAAGTLAVLTDLPAGQSFSFVVEY